jgi:rhomboid protease GluP
LDPVMSDSFERLVAAVVAPARGQPAGVLVGYQPPLAVIELPQSEAGLLVLDVSGAAPDEVAARLRRLMQGYQGGVIYVVAVGGGDELRPTLVGADREAPDPGRLSLYHLNGEGRLQRVGGRRSGPLERAARALAAQPPLAAAEAPALIERGRHEREEAAKFAGEMRGRVGRVTALLIGACVVMYGLTMLWSGGSIGNSLRGRGDGEVLLRMGANAAALVRRGEVWRLLSSAFLHLGAMHLLMNMLALQSFGGFLEAVLGWRRYLVLYGASALGGGLASALVRGVPLSVGASGAIWGLMLAGFALTREGKGLLPVRMARQLRQRLLVVLVLNVALSFVPGIDLFAHFGGGAVGFALAATGLLDRRGGDSRGLRVAAAVTGAALVAAVVVAVAVGRPWTRSAGEDLASGYGPALFVEVPAAVKLQTMVPTLAVPAKLKVALLPATIRLPLLTVPGTMIAPALTVQDWLGRTVAVLPLASRSSLHWGCTVKARSESLPFSTV